MGFDTQGARFLYFAKKERVSFAKTLMIGRQRLHLSVSDLQMVIREAGEESDPNQARTIFEKYDGYAEALLEGLGAERVDSLDFSDFEGATIVHDMNEPVSDSLPGKFSAVIDGGSLEHVFNFPVAIANCMRLVANQGHYLGITPTNNFTGHGFYQFSPELYFRIFSEPNGFRIEKMILFEEGVRDRWFEVVDPEDVRQRVTFRNRRPSYLLVIAKKESEVVPFSEGPPLQSDYVSKWDTARSAPGTGNGRQKLAAIREMLPGRVEREAANWLRSGFLRFRRDFFGRIEPFRKG